MQIELEVTHGPVLDIPLNIFTIDIRNLTGVVTRKQDGSRERLEFRRVTYNLQENSVILSTSGPSLEAGDRVSLVVEYDARVNYNVLAG